MPMSIHFLFRSLRFSSSLEEAVVLRCYKVRGLISCLDDVRGRQEGAQVKC